MATKGLVIAGLSGGSGKSVVAVGIAAAYTGQGKKIVPFKKGPDYIDAGWLQLGARARCYNLDPYLMTWEAIRTSFTERSAGADFALIEGNRGLYDGVNADGGYSTAELAVMLDLPVLLVVNCTKTTRTVAALVMGAQLFDKRVQIAGVILNQIATERQRLVITEAIEKYTGIPVLGIIPRLKTDIFPMRHLGMTPHQEYTDSSGALSTLSDLVLENVDLQRIEETMARVEVVQPQTFSVVEPKEKKKKEKLRIGLLQDAAFQFYYSENLEALENAGAELISINALRDQALPEIDGLYIGGGFPETSARDLAANVSFRESIKNSAEKGLPVYAECGGLIYLGRDILLDGVKYPLADVFPIEFGMSRKPQAHGYSIFKVSKENPYYQVGAEIKGHEFRYSTIRSWQGSADELAVTMLRGRGFQAEKDGLIFKNVFALYTHIHAGGTPEWAENFIACCKRMKEKQ